MKREKGKPWDRREGETATAYAAFALYLETPERSLPKLLQTYPKSLDNLKELSARWSWVERAAAYDSSIVEEARRDRVRQLKKIVGRKEEIGRLALEKAEEMLKTLNVQTRGSFHAAAELAEIGSRLMTDALEMDEGQDEGRRELTINIVRAGENGGHEGG